MPKSFFLSDRRMLQHHTGDHLENANRLQAILEEFKRSPFFKYLKLSTNYFASKEDLVRVHDSAYVDHVLSLDGKKSMIDYETIISPFSVKAALIAAGLGIELIEQVVSEKIANGFVIVRPPGHHARPSTGMGFCLFNNIAIAAKKALSMGIKRLLIFDFDVHHGNGTQEVFYNDDRVLFIDIHQENLFPPNSGLLNETGQARGRGFTVNIPLPKGCGDNEYLYIFDQLIKPLTMDYCPELILVSAGFDAHESDPLGLMTLTTSGYGFLTERIKTLAKSLCKEKLIFFLEGGYNPFFLAKNVIECVRILVDEKKTIDIKETKNPTSKEIERMVREIYDSHNE